MDFELLRKLFITGSSAEIDMTQNIKIKNVNFFILEIIAQITKHSTAAFEKKRANEAHAI